MLVFTFNSGVILQCWPSQLYMGHSFYALTFFLPRVQHLINYKTPFTYLCTSQNVLSLIYHSSLFILTHNNYYIVLPINL